MTGTFYPKTAIIETVFMTGEKTKVKIGGNLFAENRITGPHSSLVINENHQRLTIAETNEPDHDGVKRWRFELNPFR